VNEANWEEHGVQQHRLPELSLPRRHPFILDSGNLFIHCRKNMGSCNSKRMARRVQDPANHEDRNMYSVPPPPGPTLEIDFDVDNSGALDVVQKNMKWNQTHNHWTTHITDNHRDVNDPEVLKVIKLCGI